MTYLNPYSSQLARHVLCAAMVAFVSQTSLAAASCKFTSIDPVSFGVYDIFSAQPNNNGVGSLTIECKGGGHNTFEVTLSTGQSHSYTPRTMRSGANHLDYNLYTGADRSAVWGDGRGNQLMMVKKDHTTTLHIYGQIPAGQDAAVGTYTDSIVATVTF